MKQEILEAHEYLKLQLNNNLTDKKILSCSLNGEVIEFQFWVYRSGFIIYYIDENKQCRMFDRKETAIFQTYDYSIDYMKSCEKMTPEEYLVRAANTKFKGVLERVLLTALYLIDKGETLDFYSICERWSYHTSEHWSGYNDDSVKMSNFEWKHELRSYYNPPKNGPTAGELIPEMTFVHKNYPRLGRLELVQSYYGFENIKSLKVNSKFNHKGKEYVIIEKTECDSEPVISFVETNVKLNRDFNIPEDKIKRGIGYDAIDDSWDCLCPENRIGVRRKKYKSKEITWL